MSSRNAHTEKAQDPGKSRLAGGIRSLAWIAAVTLILGAAAAAGFYWERTVTVREVTFHGNEFTSDSLLSAAVEIPLGVSPDSLDYPRIRRGAERLPWVRRAGVEVEPGGTLRIRITERRPIALLAGSGMYVDGEGVLLPVRPEEAADLPLLYGFAPGAPGDTLGSEAFRSAAAFLELLRERPVSDATVSEVAWSNQEGVVALTHENGVKLLFGRENFKRKLQNWETFYAEIIRREGMQNMRELDLRFSGQIVSR